MQAGEWGAVATAFLGALGLGLTSADGSSNTATAPVSPVRIMLLLAVLVAAVAVILRRQQRVVARRASRGGARSASSVYGLQVNIAALPLHVGRVLQLVCGTVDSPDALDDIVRRCDRGR